MFVCEFALLFGRMYSCKSLFFWSAALSQDFFSKRESSHRERVLLIHNPRNRERVYFATRPAFLFNPTIYFRCMCDDIQTSTSVYTNWERRECEEEQVFPNALSRSSSSRFAIFIRSAFLFNSQKNAAVFLCRWFRSSLSISIYTEQTGRSWFLSLSPLRETIRTGFVDIILQRGE